MLEESEKIVSSAFPRIAGGDFVRPIDCFRCTRRTCCGYPQRLPGSKLITVQGAFHAQYSPQEQRELCSECQNHLDSSHQRACLQASRKICRQCGHRFSKCIRCLEDGLDDSLAFYAFPQLHARKISSTDVLKRLKREIRRRTGLVRIFPSPDIYTRLVTTHLMECAEDWSSFRVYLSEQSVQVML